MQFDSILNQYRDEELSVTQKGVSQLPLFVCPRIDVARVYGLIGDVQEGVLEADVRLTAEESKSVALFEEQTLQASDIHALQDDYSAVQTELTVQDSAIHTLQDGYTGVQAEQLLQNTAIASLEDGLLPRVHFEDNGGAHLLLKGAEESFVDVTTGLIPSSASLETYDAAGVIGSSITLQGDLVTLNRDVKVEGKLILNEKNVADQLLSLEDKAKQYAIEQAASIAAEIAQDSLLAALAAYSARPPSGYTALPEDTFPDPDLEDSTRVPPFKLFPAGQFDDLGPAGEVLATRVNLKGKATLNAPETLPTRVWEVHGDAIYKKLDNDDEYEVEYQCKLGSKVAIYNTSNVLTNSGAVAVRLGTNSNVTVGGQVNAAEVVADSFTGAKVNGTSIVKTLHAAQGLSTRDVRRDIAIQSIRTSAALREAIRPDAVSKDLRRDVAIQSIRTSAALRKAIKPAVSKDYQSDIQRLRDEAAYDRRDLFRPSPISKNYDMVIAELKSRTTQTQSRSPVTADFAPRFGRLSNAIVRVQRLVKPVFSSSYTAVINTLRAAISVIRQDVRVLKTRKNVVVPDTRPALKRLMDSVTLVQRRVKPTASTDLRPAIQRTNDRISALSTSTNNYTQTLTTSDANNLKVRIGTADQMVVTSTSTTVNNNLTVNSTGNTFNGKLCLDVNLLGGATRGISFASLSDTNWGCYLATVGANKSFANGTTAGYGGITSYAIRTRCSNSTTAGCIWENSSEVCNMALNASTGNLTVRGLLTPGSISTTGSCTLASATLSGTLGVTGNTTLSTLTATGAVSTGTLTVNGDINVTGVVNTVSVEQISVQDKIIILASSQSEGALLNGSGIQIGFDILQPNNLIFNNASWNSSIPMNMPTLGVTGNSTLATVTATTLTTTSNAAINGILRMGTAGTSTIAGYQGGTIYFNGPLGDHQDGFSGIQCKNYTNGTSNTEATELLLWQLNDPYNDSGPDRIRLYAGEIRFDTYIAAVGAGSQYTESTRMKIMPNGYVGIGEPNPRGTLHLSFGANTTTALPNLCCTNGVGAGASSIPQISFGYNGNKDYNHFISSRHYGGQVAGNSLDFYTCDGTANNTINNTKYCMSINGGRVGINKFDPTDQLHVVGNSTFEGVNQCKGTRFTQGAQNSSFGNIINFWWTGGALEAYVDTSRVSANISDYRVKKGISLLGDGCLDKIMKLRPVNYSFKDNGIFKNDDTIRLGFIAHEVQAVIPEGANGVKDKKDKDGLDEFQSLNVMPILSTLVKAVQELSTKVQALEKLGLKIQ